MSAHLLTVCTGNICRSPVAERLLQARLSALGVVAESAGTGAVVGAPIAPAMVDLLATRGVNVDDFEARQITEALVRSADLVLTMTRAHRSAVVELVPAAVRRTFTLTEFARLSALAEVPRDVPADERLRALVSAVGASRSRLRPTPGGDVVDPWRESPQVYRAAFDHIDQATNVIAHALGN